MTDSGADIPNLPAQAGAVSEWSMEVSIKQAKGAILYLSRELHTLLVGSTGETTSIIISGAAVQFHQ